MVKNINFFKRVYKIVRTIPRGKVSTYGQIADILNTKDARKVGWALHANSDKKTPCHRVVSKEGNLAKNFAFGGENEQRLLLQSEGVEFIENKVDLTKSLWHT